MAIETNHEAFITKADENASQFIKGEFSVVAGKLSFVCISQNVEFDEVEAALTMLRSEIDRQIAHKHLCPFYRN